MLRIVGSCRQRLFGMKPAERLRRQWNVAGDFALVAHASAVLGDAAIGWMRENPGTALTTPEGRAVAVVCRPGDVDTAEGWVAAGAAPGSLNPARMEPMFVRKLRRRDTLLVLSLDESPRGAAERALFDTVYKGVTDLVTKYAWPLPAYWATRLCAGLGISPNAVTLIGIALVAAVAYLWAGGAIAAGLALAWLMTFLDTVDGKLARVTATSSEVGNILDHATDIIHPPIWWICLAVGLASLDPAKGSAIWAACWVILGGYIFGRAIEEMFKRRIGYNAYLWRPFDSAFRLIVSRRNVILLIMTMGLLAGGATAAYLTAAAWTAISVLVQLVRFVQANRAAHSGATETWLK